MAVSESIFQAANSTLLSIKNWLGGDEKQNAEPVHSTVYDIDADDHNKRASGTAEIAKRIRPGNPVRYRFHVANLAASLTDSQLADPGDAAILGAAAWLDYSVVGISYYMENAQTAGALTVNWSIGGTKQQAGTFEATGASGQTGRAQQLPGTAGSTGSNGDVLGVQVTTDGSFAAGATPSLVVDLLVSYGEEEDI